MKKIVFAVQVIGLMTMLPLVVILEINHTTGSFPRKKSTAGITKKAAIIMTPSAGELKIKYEEALFNLPENIILLKPAY